MSDEKLNPPANEPLVGDNYHQGEPTQGVDPVEDAERVEEGDHSRAPAPSVEHQDPQAHAESVTGAQDVIKETNGEAPLPRGIVPEASEGVNHSDTRAEATIQGDDSGEKPQE